jgi:hypothetical protein
MSKRKKNNRPDKSVCQKLHCKKRCLERFGFEPNRESFRVWITAIQKGHATFVYKQSNRVSIFDYNHYGHKLRLVYDSVRKVVCTVLTQDMDPIEIEEKQHGDFWNVL